MLINYHIYVHELECLTTQNNTTFTRASVLSQYTETVWKMPLRLMQSYQISVNLHTVDNQQGATVRVIML